MSSGSPDLDEKATDAPAELNAVVEDLLNQLTAKFSAVSSEMMNKMDDMSRRLDSLEAMIQQTGAQGSNDETRAAT